MFLRRIISIQNRLFSTNAELYKKYLEDDVKKLIVATGPAGSGKTMMACNEAILRLKKSLIKKIVITRPLICADNDIGYLPGNLEEKMAPWTRPIFDVFYEHYPKNKIMQFVQNDLIEICPLAFMRGRTFKNAFIIGDELQNANIEQMKMLLTRIGENSRMVINGDLSQKDITGYSGLEDFLQIMQNKKYDESIGIISLNYSDVKRSEIVKRILELYK